MRSFDFPVLGKEGHLRAREFGDQLHTFSCLSVLHHAVVAWSTLHIGRVVEELRAEGYVLDEATLALTTPLFHEPINRMNATILTWTACATRSIP
ncbi:MAG: Tn3 family transposase [Nitrospirota bacterium]